VQEQEYEGGPSAAELQEKLTLASGDDALETLNGRLPIDAAPVKSLNGKASVFDDF